VKPYYEDGAVTIYHGDCREILPALISERAELVLTDPPFFMPAIHYQSRVQWQRSWSDTSVLAAFWATVLELCIPLMPPRGHFLTFCNGDSYPVFYPEIYRRFDFLKSLVWDKGHVGLGRVWRSQHELLIAARWSEAKFADDGKLRSDVLRYDATPSSDRLHPLEKPPALLRSLIEPTTQLGACVLDPFAGSGTTLEAAKILGRRAIGIEGEERYCEIAAKRCSQEVFDFGDVA
jgi:site-specific DNA-methyltransferase (adenine-specific)